jgi:hypothetical protein
MIDCHTGSLCCADEVLSLETIRHPVRSKRQHLQHGSEAQLRRDNALRIKQISKLRLSASFSSGRQPTH